MRTVAWWRWLAASIAAVVAALNWYYWDRVLDLFDSMLDYFFGWHGGK